MNKKNSVWQNMDWITVSIYLLLMFLGWLNIYAAVYNDEHQSIFDFSQSYGKQIIWIGAALFIAMCILVIDSRFFVTFAFPIYIVIILTLIIVLLLGRNVNGARSWFQIGNFAIQPAEFAKMATAMALARYISSYHFKMQTFKSMAAIATIIGIPVLLIILQNDTGSALVFAVFLLVLYREGLNGLFLFFGGLVAVLFVLALVLSPAQTVLMLIIGAFIASLVLVQNIKDSFRGLVICFLIYISIWGSNYLFKLELDNEKMAILTIVPAIILFAIYALRKNIRNLLLIVGLLFASLIFTFSVDFVFDHVLESHQQARINDLLGIENDILGVGYNVNQSKIAIGSGGFLGKGFLHGTQTKYDFVPEQSTDFIFCTVGEEWGFIGSVFTIGLFVLLLLRLINLAEKQRTKFSRIYGYSVACILFFHFTVNIGMTIGLAPVIGIPLPFFSYGGSSLWSFTILLFIFLRLDASRFEQLGY